MIVGLAELRQGIANKKMQDFAYNIVKYQKFKTSTAIKNINYDCSEKTKMLYFNAGVKYIKTKEREKYVPPTIYEYIDEALDKHIQPLTPSLQDERRVYAKKLVKKFTKKDDIPPVAKLDIIQKIQSKTDSNCEYGVKLSDTEIKICKNRDYAIGFAEGLKYLGKTDVKVITIKIGEISE